MKDFSGYSDDDLLNELEHLSLEISCELGTERGTTLEKLFWLVTKELERRGIDPITGDEIIVGTDVLDDDYEEEVEVEEKGNFGFGREEGRFDEYDLPF